jgi:hypothetical protein
VHKYVRQPRPIQCGCTGGLRCARIASPAEAIPTKAPELARCARACVRAETDSSGGSMQTCDTRQATRRVQNAACSMQHATGNMQHATVHTQHARCNTQHP